MPTGRIWGGLGWNGKRMAGEAAQDQDWEAAEKAAARWFAKRHRQLTSREDAQFFRWLRASEVHLDAYEAVMRVWDVSLKAADDPVIVAMRREALAARRSAVSGD